MIISRTPLRVSFIGGGTDFPDFYEKYNGAVISSAIDKYVYVIAKRRFDDKIVLHYTRTETVDSFEDVQHDLIRESMRMAGIEKGIEITTLADIPSEGTGLGSSSSLTVGLLHALFTLNNIEVSPAILAEKACRIEIENLGKGIGKQDQYIAAYGGLRLIIFQQKGIASKPIRREIRRGLEERLSLFFTGKTRDASPILKAQVTSDNRDEILGKMTKSCLLARTDLENKGYQSFLESMNKGWHLKKQLADSVSNPEIEIMYQKAMDAGAIGCKVCGAGGGGYLLVGFEPEDKAAISNALSDYKELPLKLEPEGSKIVYKEYG